MSDEEALDRFLGTWELTEHHNFEAVLEAMDVNIILRKAAALLAKNTVKFERIDPKTVKFSASNPVKSVKFEFQLGVTFVETTPDGRKVNSTVTVDKDTGSLIHDSQPIKDTDKPVKIIRSLCKDGQEMQFEITCDGVVCTHKYKRTA